MKRCNEKLCSPKYGRRECWDYIECEHCGMSVQTRIFTKDGVTDSKELLMNWDKAMDVKKNEYKKPTVKRMRYIPAG